MRSGALDRVIKIRKVVENLATPNAYGVLPKGSGTNTGVHRAELLDTSSENVAQGNITVTKDVVSFRLRWVPNVVAGDRLTYKEKEYDIRLVKEIGRRKSIELTAREL